MSYEETMKRIVEKIGPSVLDIMAKNDNGEIRLQFGQGQFKQARKEVTL